MNRALRVWLAVAALLLGSIGAVHAGGWTIITLADIPEFVQADRPLTLTFSVRQHGVTPLDGLKPVVRASTSGRLEVVAGAAPTGREGEYSATLWLDSPGDWQIRVDSGFNPDDKTRQYNSLVLPPLTVVRAGSAPIPVRSKVDRGGRLIVAKGCLGCHGPGGENDLGGKLFDAGYLRAFLADPGIRNAPMPNLGLTEPEISALVAFINRPRGAE